MSAGGQLLRDANDAMASVRAGRPRYLSVAEAERALRGGLPSNHRPATGIPGWEGLGGEGDARHHGQRAGGAHTQPNSVRKQAGVHPSVRPPVYRRDSRQEDDGVGSPDPVAGWESLAGVLDRAQLAMDDLRNTKESKTAREWELWNRMRELGRVAAERAWVASHTETRDWAGGREDEDMRVLSATAADPCGDDIDVCCRCSTPGMALRDEYAAHQRPMMYLCEGNESLVRHAWQLLSDYSDIVNAATLHVVGVYDLLGDAINSSGSFWWSPIHVTCLDLVGISAEYKGYGWYNADALALWYGRVIRLDSDYLRQLQSFWDTGSAQSGDVRRKYRALAAADLAALLAHELMHAVGYSPGDTVNNGEASYRVGNYVRYHLGRELCVLGWGYYNWTNSSETSDCGNYQCLIWDDEFNSDTYRVDVSNVGEEGTEAERHNVYGSAGC